jgi:restriction endonuclease S subunit
MDNNGYIPFYSCIANNPAGFHSKETFDYQEYLLIVASGGSQKNIVGDNVGLGKNYYVTGKTACRSNVYALILKIDNVSIKYLHYYLNLNRIKINNKAKFTTNLGVISKTDLSNMKIPIPSLEVQNKIVENLDYNNEIIRNLEKEIELNKMKAEEFFKQIL